MKAIVSQFFQNHHFDVQKLTRVKCDAFEQGLGAALDQLHSDGWKPISYASRFLNEAELKYSKSESEFLAVVCDVTDYQNYFLGAQFRIVADHEALPSCLSEERNT